MWYVSSVRSLFQKNLNKKQLVVKWWSKFWVLYFYETFICYRRCLNLNCYIGKKVQKNFLMGLEIWWSWGSGFLFFSKSSNIRRFSIYHAQLPFLRGWVLFLSKKTIIFRYFLENRCSRWAQGAIPACITGEYQPLSLVRPPIRLIVTPYKRD